MAGQERARAKGKHIGRPRSEAKPDALKAASTLIAQGWSLRQVAKATGLNEDTLRRRLAEVDVEAAAPPRPAVLRTPAIPA